MTPKLSPEQRQAIDEHNGQPIFVVDPDRQQQFILLSAADVRVRDLLTDTSSDDEWTDEKDARRCELIDKDIAGTITESEKVELHILQQQGNEHYDRVAPPPMEGARRLHQQLLSRADKQ